jgi:uncharacterized sporulation protein YeaH/YhbH (DUF444 family)
MSFTIIDRRLNPGGKNLSNRQRFIKKAKEQLKKSVKDGLVGRSITSDEDQDVHISQDGISEPVFQHDRKTGKREFILPGNKEFMPGDLIEKPKGGAGSGSKGSPDGNGEDDFQFQISRDEFNDILFDGLELPDLIKKSDKRSSSFTRVRAGFTNSGNPATLDLESSLIKSLGRRIALKNPKLRKIKKLEEELLFLQAIVNPSQEELERIETIKEEIKTLRKKAEAISYLDPIDLRYRNYDKKIIPKHQAVMFCIMDVSGSMGEHEKDLAKRFYMLLYLFLTYKYQRVDVVYIRHHSTATECSEDEFFYSKESGGTVVSEGILTMQSILKERYAVDDWNIYVAQTSDGDNFDNDNEKLINLLSKEILPIVQYYAYIEVGSEDAGMNSLRSSRGIWPFYEKLQSSFENLKMRKAQDPKHIYSVFRELFEKE